MRVLRKKDRRGLGVDYFLYPLYWLKVGGLKWLAILFLVFLFFFSFKETWPQFKQKFIPGLRGKPQ